MHSETQLDALRLIGVLQRQSFDASSTPADAYNKGANPDAVKTYVDATEKLISEVRTFLTTAK